jgi:hypothetical protein
VQLRSRIDTLARVTGTLRGSDVTQKFLVEGLEAIAEPRE